MIGRKETKFSDAEVLNIAGTGGMTCSGRVFAPKYTPKVIPAPVVVPPPPPQARESVVVPTSKGKEVAKEQKHLTAEEGQEFLKLVKKSDFKIVDQLGQTPSKISILSLLLSSEALLKVFNDAHVMQDITVDQFDDIVDNITTSWCLGFNEAELKTEGDNHNKALHISVTCADTLVSRVPVDIGSSLNMLPKITLSQLQFEGPKMQASCTDCTSF